MEETVAGFTFRGRWKDVVKRSEEVSKALESAEVDESDSADFEQWRPRESERFSKEFREKTVKQARIDKNEAMEDGKTATRDAKKSVKNVTEAVEEASSGDMDDAVAEGTRALTRLARSADTAARKSMRVFETVVYKHVVARTNPQYFDGGVISAAVAKDGKPWADQKEYSLEVHITDDGVRDEVTEQLKADD